MKSVSLIIWLGCLFQVSLSQNWQQVDQPKFEDYFCIDACNTDYGEGKELVRTQRSFLLKKLFKKWGKWFRDDCVECCQQNAGYSGGSAGNGDGKVVNPVNTNNYQNSNSYGNSNGYENSNSNSNSNYDNNKNAQNYDNYGYDGQYQAPDIPTSPSRGHLYLPLPHSNRVITHLHGYFNNRPFRGGYSEPNNQPSLYPPKEAYVDEVAPAAEPEVETNAVDYETPPAQVVESDDNSYTSEVIEEKTSDYDTYSSNKEDKKDATPEVTQIIQPIVPVYIYPPNYSEDGKSNQKYSEGQSSYKSPSTESSSSYESPTTPYSSPPPTITLYALAPNAQPASSYSPPSSSYSSADVSYSSSLPNIPHVPAYLSPASTFSPPSAYNSAPASSYSPPTSSNSYTAPTSSSSPPAQSYAIILISPAKPSYSPSAQSYSPAAPIYSIPAHAYISPAATYSPVDPTYSPSAPSYSPAAQSYSQPGPSYSSPASSYKPQVPSYSPPALPYSSSYSPLTPSYSPPAASYAPLSPSYSPPATSYSLPATPYSLPATSYSPPATSYSPPAQSYSPSDPSYSSPPSPTYSPPTPSYPQPSPPELPHSNSDAHSLSPSICSPLPYYKRTYSTTLTYEIPPCSPPSYENDHNIRSCPELFKSYIGPPMTPSSPY